MFNVPSEVAQSYKIAYSGYRWVVVKNRLDCSAEILRNVMRKTSAFIPCLRDLYQHRPQRPTHVLQKEGLGGAPLNRGAWGSSPFSPPLIQACRIKMLNI
ncbi:hypothetical protein NQ317_010193 [Molorchus minor]|uniref:Uncharacterized protein n=1 Tax=Molorchus minor TaxID=1323400 RepID=A0ABQ9JWQ7_9CUCU|nr:hypothetical protein NQ317_010193 [Molorchus minor]